MLCQRKRVGCRICKACLAPCAEVFHRHLDKARAIRKGILIDTCEAAVRRKADVDKSRAAGECRRLNGGYACRNNHMLHIGCIPESICADGCHACRNLQGCHRLAVCVIQLSCKHHRVCVVVSKGGAAPCSNVAELHLFQCRTVLESICADGNRLAVFGKGNRRKAAAVFKHRFANRRQLAPRSKRNRSKTAAVVKRMISDVRYTDRNRDACEARATAEHIYANVSQTVGERDGHKRSAFFKCILCNRFYAICQGNAFETAAIGKCICTNACHTFQNGHAFEIAAVREGIIFN